jgi:hypothetical protein
MLQIASGKFFSTDKCFETLHRGLFYTNYRTFQNVIDLPLGRLLPSTGMTGMATLTYELMEKIEYTEPSPGTMTSTGGYELVDDLSSVFSYALNVICTKDRDLLIRLTSSDELHKGNSLRKYLRRVFDQKVTASPADNGVLQEFIAGLIGLRRSAYERAMKAIRRYVTATHRIADDTSLAYSLFVMSLEALAQTADTPAAKWTDYEEAKRERIDEALKGAPDELKERVRSAVLNNEHVAASRKFRDFTIQHLSPAFFRAEAVEVTRPIRRPDLVPLLRRAYDIRSGYVHRLEGVHKLLVMPFTHTETFEIDGALTLTFEGLSRLARHVITEFVRREPKVAREEFYWRAALPNVVTMPLSTRYWLGRPEGYTPDSARRWLQNFLQEVSAHLLAAPDAALTDLSAILDKIENMPLDNVKARDRRAILALYHLFIILAGPKYERARHQELLNHYQTDFAAPTVEHLAMCLVTERDFPWSLPQMEQLFDAYWGQRHHKNGLNVGELLEAVFTLRLVEINRTNGNEARARELILFAVEAFPSNSAVRELESDLALEKLNPVAARNILLPRLATKENEPSNALSDPENANSE